MQTSTQDIEKSINLHNADLDDKSEELYLQIFTTKDFTELPTMQTKLMLKSVQKIALLTQLN